ncbi:uncharacterized protein LOC140704310 [Pogona vitticeps]
MDPRRYIGAGILNLLLLLIRLVSGRPHSSGIEGHKVQDETKECGLKYYMNIPRGGSRSVMLPVNTTGQILVSRWDSQKREEKYLLVGVPNNLNKHDNKTEVSLDNQIFTLQNAKKADEGLYRIREYITQRCLAQVIVTLSDPTPPPGITNSPNGNIPVTPTQDPPENNYTGVDVFPAIVILAVIILAMVLVIILRNKKIITCIKRRTSQPRRNASAGFSPEEETVL